MLIPIVQYLERDVEIGARKLKLSIHDVKEGDLTAAKCYWNSVLADLALLARPIRPLLLGNKPINDSVAAFLSSVQEFLPHSPENCLIQRRSSIVALRDFDSVTNGADTTMTNAALSLSAERLHMLLKWTVLKRQFGLLCD